MVLLHPVLKITRVAPSYAHVFGAHVGDMKRQHILVIVRQSGAEHRFFFENDDCELMRDMLPFLIELMEFVHKLA